MNQTSTLSGLWLPAETEPARAVLIVLHGLGDSANGWSMLPDELELPGLSYVFLNAPDPYYNGFAWYDLFGNQAEGIRRSCALLHRAIDDQVQKGFAPAQIGLFGFSQGCVMAFEAGLRYPKRLGAIVGVSGYVYEPEALFAAANLEARQVPILMTHGTQDTLLPIEKTRANAKLLQDLGLPLEWKEFRKAHTVAGAEEFGLIRRFLVGALGLGKATG